MCQDDLSVVLEIRAHSHSLSAGHPYLKSLGVDRCKVQVLALTLPLPLVPPCGLSLHGFAFALVSELLLALQKWNSSAARSLCFPLSSGTAAE